MEWLGFVAGTFELLGAYLVGSKKRISFLAFIAGGVCWIAYSIVTHSAYGLIMVCSISIILNLRAYKKWGIKHDN